MWIYLNDAFVSIVAHREKRDLLCCRGRLQGDLQRAFRGHLKGRRVKHTPGADYAYRIEMPRALVAKLLAQQVREIDYPNFKGSVRDPGREALYLRVWGVMKSEQDRRERQGGTASLFGIVRPGRIPSRNADGLLECGHCEYEEADGSLRIQCSACQHEQELEEVQLGPDPIVNKPGESLVETVRRARAKPRARS